jgi:anthranilate phosphoribosyltransferase
VSALVFRGDDGLDEITTTTTSRVWIVRSGEAHEERLDPSALGIPRASADALRGGEAPFNADVARRLLAGEPGPVRDAVLLNAAAALVAYEGVTGDLVDLLMPALDRAAAAVDSGAAEDVLTRWAAACSGSPEPA